MKILLINHYAGSPVYGMEYRPYYLAREWVKFGHEVTVVSASFSHLRRRQPRLNTKISRENIDGIQYLWLSTPEYRGNGIRRAINISVFVKKLFRYRKKIASEIAPDVVIASSTYPLDIYPANSIAKRAGAKLIFEVHDLWPLSPMELDGMSPMHPFIVVMQRAENYAYKNADTVVSLLPKADSHMKDHGMAPEKFVYIPNGVDVTEWGKTETPLPDIHDKTLEKLKAEGRFIVGYAGGHGLSNALDSLIDAASFIKDEPVSLVLVGQGPEKERLQKIVRGRGLDNVVFLSPVPRDSVPGLLQRMDSFYIGWQRKSLYRYGINPNKLFDYMMAAKPVIHAVDAGNDPVSESSCGISIAPEDPEALAGAIIELMHMSNDERKTLGENGRNYVMANHDYSILAQEFADIMQKRNINSDSTTQLRSSNRLVTS
jgi:glycosyltransferase involved in cell wall biosynthesis